MESIEESLRAIEREVAAGDPIALDRALGRATEIGARIGQLQVSCCAPARMPLYGEALTHLNTLQRVLAGRLGRGH